MPSRRVSPSRPPRRSCGWRGELARDFPDAFIHSHLAETPGEIAWVRQLFPASRSYLDVYDGHGLLRDRAVYAHCIYLDENDRRRMAQSGAAAAFCPTSNPISGQRTVRHRRHRRGGQAAAPTATDVGGGSSLSMLRTLDEARKVARLQGQDLHPLRAFFSRHWCRVGSTTASAHST